MDSVILKQREVFEKETFPHLEALWRFAWWLNMGSSSAEKFVIKTIVRAYNEWPIPLNVKSSKVMLFSLLTDEIFGVGKQRQKLFDSDQFVSEDIMTTIGSEEGYPNDVLSAIDQLGLLLPNGLSEGTVSRIINQLRPRPRLILLLLYIGEFSYADIAFITDLPLKSVRIILFRISRLIPVYILKYNVPRIYPKKALAKCTIDNLGDKGRLH